MIKLSRYIRKTTGAIALSLAMIAGLSFNNFNTLLTYAATTGIVNTDVLNVRSGPSKEYRRLATIRRNTELTILDTQNGWYKVQTGNLTGFVSADYVRVNGQQTDVSGKQGVVNVSVLNIRSAADKGSRCIGALRDKTTVNILGQEGDWYKIQVGGTTGYVFAEYVTVLDQPAAPQTPAPSVPTTGKTGMCDVSALNIRKSADKKSAICGLLRKGDRFEILGQEGDWYKIKAGTTTGYAFAEHIKVVNEGTPQVPTVPETPETPQTPQTPEAPQTTSKNGKCLVTALNVRSKATTKSAVIGSLSKDKIVEIIAKEGEWYKINATLNGRAVTGYVFAEYIQLTDEAVTTPPAQNNNQNTPTENNGKKGVCDTYALNVRKGPGINHAIIGSLSRGQGVTIEETKDGWYKVKVDGSNLTGYVSVDYIKISDEAPEKPETKPETDGFTEVNEVVWATDGVNIRKGPGTNYEIIGSLVKNAAVTRIGVGTNGWSKVRFGKSTGYIASQYLKAKNPNPNTSGHTAEAVVEFAKQFEGGRYIWGGNDLYTGVDCSGFTQQVYLHFGYHLNRSADQQRLNGRAVSVEEIKPGDLVFYGSGSVAGHVALYIGDGNVIHASTPEKGIIISNMFYRTPMQVNRIIE